MKKSSALAPGLSEGQREPGASLELEFPVAPEFSSRPPRLDPRVMLRLCAETMPWRSSRPEERARRLAEAVPVEFVL